MEVMRCCSPWTTIPFFLRNRTPAFQLGAQFPKIKTIPCIWSWPGGNVLAKGMTALNNYVLLPLRANKGKNWLPDCVAWFLDHFAKIPLQEKKCPFCRSTQYLSRPQRPGLEEARPVLPPPRNGHMNPHVKGSPATSHKKTDRMTPLKWGTESSQIQRQKVERWMSRDGGKGQRGVSV